MHRRTTTAVAAILAAVLFLAGAPAHADDPQPPPASGPQPPSGYSSWQQLMDEQNTLANGLASIRAAATTAGDTGYSTATVDPTTHRVDLWWKGTPSAAVSSAITTARQSITVNLYNAPYTEAQMVSEAERIAATSTKFAEVEPASTGTGVKVYWRTGQQDAALQAATIAQASVGVTFAGETRDAPPQPTSRQNDDAPWSAGARTNVCTTGWAANSTTGTKLLTAAHCATLGSVKQYDGAGQLIGSINNYDTARDIGFISGAQAKGAMWDGGVQSTYSKQVQDVLPSAIGLYVCSSGSRSGVICGGQVKATNIAVWDFRRMTRIEVANHTTFGGQGDSGGPVFGLGSNSRVRALGITAQGDTATTVGCTGDGGRSCFWRVYVADVALTLAYWGMSIRTQQS